MGRLKFWAIALILFSGCWSDSSSRAEYYDTLTPALQQYSYGQLIETSGGDVSLDVLIADSFSKRNKGLSGTKDKNWPQDLGLLFWFDREGQRTFWMPDTYFDLQIIYLNSQLEILYIHSNVPHHPGSKDSPENPIWRGKGIYAQHVLEVRSKDPISQKLKLGQRFRLVRKKD